MTKNNYINNIGLDMTGWNKYGGSIGRWVTEELLGKVTANVRPVEIVECLWQLNNCYMLLEW